MARLRAAALIHRPSLGTDSMLDILLLGLGIGVFALMAAYAYACERI
jgi:hypothetical protein